MKKDGSLVDFVYEKLTHRVCPIHDCEMKEIHPFTAGPDYRRDRYRCLHCKCGVDFVGDEIKTDSVAGTLEYMGLLELTCQKVIWH